MKQNIKRKIKYKNIFKVILICLLSISVLTSCSLDTPTVSIEQYGNQNTSIKLSENGLVKQEVYQKATVTLETAIVSTKSTTGQQIETLALKSKVKATVTPTPKLKPKAKATLTPKPKAKATPTPKPKAKATPTPKPKAKATPTPKPKATATPTPKPTVKATVTPTPALTPATSFITPPPRSKEDTLEEYAQQILNLIIQEDMSDVQKVKVVHDYIVLNTKYDIDNYNKNTIPDSSFAAEGVLYKGTAVCQGYAYAFQQFMELLAIDSKVVVGYSLKDGVSHAWNMVSLGGNWYQVDTTWDDPVPDQAGTVQYNYFLMTDTIMAADHSWKKSNYPTCSSENYIYYTYEDNIISSIDDYEVEFMKRYNEGQRKITLLYPEKEIPSMRFLLDYENTRTETVEGNKTTYSYNYNYYPAWRLGDYTVYTVIME